MTFPIGGYTDSTAASADNLLHGWNFDEIDVVGWNNNIVSDGQGSRDLTVRNESPIDSTISSQGKFKNCRDFSLQLSNAAYANSSSLSDALPVWSSSFWIYLENLPVSGDFYQCNRFSLSPSNGNDITNTGGTTTFQYKSNGALLLESTALSAHTWYHFVIVSRSSTDHELYQDGISVDTSVASSSLTIDQIYISAGLSSQAFDGRIDEWGIWESELSSTSISNLFNSGNGSPIYASIIEESFSDNIEFTDSLPYDTQILRIILENFEVSTDIDLPYYISLLKEQLRVGDTFNATQTIHKILAETTTLKDIALLVFYLQLEEGIDYSESLNLLPIIIKRIVEMCSLSDTIYNTQVANMVLAEATSFVELVSFFIEELLGENIDITSTLNRTYKGFPEISDGIDFTDSTQLQLSFTQVLEESVAIDEDNGVLSIFNHTASDGIVLGGVQLSDGDSTYSGWVMNPRTFSVWNYSDFNFNAITKYNNEYFASRDDGIYKITGTKDDGEYIQSKLVTAAMSFDSSNKKQVPQLYLGARADGSLILKVRVDNRADVWYNTIPVQSDLHTHKIRLGKGLIGRYWQFELITVDNDILDIDDIELYPVVLKRKI